MSFELFKLEGRVALVTGGGSGLGQAIACGLAGVGARILVAHLSPEGAQETVNLIQERGAEARVAKLDVTVRSEVEAVVAATLQGWGTIDILVNSAGIAIKGEAINYPESAWDTVISTNLKGTFLTCQAVG